MKVKECEIKIATGSKKYTSKEMDAFKHGFTESSMMILKVCRDLLEFANDKENEFPEKEKQLVTNLLANIATNVISITEEVRENISSNTETIIKFETMEKSEETIRH